jgi:hypothetical protein
MPKPFWQTDPKDGRVNNITEDIPKEKRCGLKEQISRSPTETVN